MEKNKILIFGKGFIGLRLAEEMGCSVSERRINSILDIQEEIEKYHPQIIINCVGYTGKSNVDDCENNKDKTLMANTFVPIILAEAALRNNIKLIHIGSGCIYHFDYEKQAPIDEEFIPDYFELFYSRSKIYSENALKAILKKANALIIRIRIPLDNRSSPKNILDKLIKYKKVINIPNSITYIPDFIKALKHLIKVDAKGIYNVVNKGGLRYPELMKIYQKYVPDFKYKIISLVELNLLRTNLILSTEKLEKTGFKVRNISEILEESVKGYLMTRNSEGL